MSRDKTIVRLGDNEIIIDNNKYYNATSIKINPKAALIIPAFVITVGAVAWPTIIYGMSAAISGIFGLDMLATTLIVGASTVATLWASSESLQGQGSEVGYDSCRFTYDFLKATILGQDQEHTQNSQSDEVTPVGLNDQELQSE